MKKIQNILISGGNGRIGSSLSNYLLNKGHKIVVGDLHFNNITKHSTVTGSHVKSK